MRGHSPLQPEGTTPEFIHAKTMHGRVLGVEGQFNNSTTVKVSKTPRGYQWHANIPQQSTPGITFVLYKVTSESADRVSAVTTIANGDGTFTDGETPVDIAKPFHLRIAPTDNFIIHPPYIVDGAPYTGDANKDSYQYIFAVQNPTGGTGIGGVTWIDINCTARAWASVKDVCIDSIPMRQNFVASQPY